MVQSVERRTLEHIFDTSVDPLTSAGVDTPAAMADLAPRPW